MHAFNPGRLIIEAGHHTELLPSRFEEDLAEFDFKLLQGLKPVHHKGWSNHGDVGHATLCKVDHCVG
tara:strand:+ start:689 stop:889 length:201 start_codon:yes stop_codon:yes gene_type:complete